MRNLLKASVEEFLASWAVPLLWRGSRRTPVAILSYHNVVPAGDPPLGDISLHLPLDEFRSHLDSVQEFFGVIPLRSLLDGDVESSRPSVAITFDDAYRGALDLGIPELLSRGLPATVFVSPGLLGAPGFWWDLLADPEGGGLPSDIRVHALSNLEGSQEEVLQWASTQGLRSQPVGAHYQPVENAEVRSLVKNSLIGVGSHTWSHVDLASASPDRARGELEKPVGWLEKIGGSPEIISYPYGSIEAGQEKLVRGAGYRMGFMIRGGRASREGIRNRPFSIPRINVPRGLSPEGLILRATGTWLG